MSRDTARGEMSRDTARGEMSRGAYVRTLLACLAGAGLAIWAATRTWSSTVQARPGLSDLRTVRTGAELEPWLVGLALVAVAGTGALLATHGWVRRLLGGLLTLVGAGVVAGAIAGRVGLAVGEAGTGGTLWPVACGLGGAIIAGGGLTAARLGHRWPGMSARYERGLVPPPEPEPGAPPGPSAAAGRESAVPLDHRTAWDALDRGDDPTDS